jgi:outer membrane lipoprotein carrier protein
MTQSQLTRLAAAALVAGAAWAPAAGAQQPPAARQPEAGAQASGDRAAAATIDRAAQAVRSARTVRATFEQTLTNPATGNSNVATGELALGRPNRLAVRFNNAAGDRVVVDGTNLWVYVPSAVPGQVLKQPARGNAAASIDALSDLLTAPRSRYRVSDAGAATVGGRATRAVVLTPKDERSPLTQAKVWVDDRDGAVRQIELTEATGGVRTWRFTTWQPNAALAADTFRFTVPAGVRVVDQIAISGGATAP